MHGLARASKGATLAELLISLAVVAVVAVAAWPVLRSLLAQQAGARRYASARLPAPARWVAAGNSGAARSRRSSSPP